MKNLNSIYNSAIFSFKQNLFKSLFAFLFSSFVLGFANIICSFIIILTSKTYILPFVSLFVLLVINTALNFGLQLLIFFLYKNEYAVIGHLFYFFKDLKRISLVCIFQIISYFILIYISFIPYMFLGDASQDVEFFTALLDFQTLQTEATNIEYFKQVFSKGLSFGFLLSTIICVILVLLFHLITSFIPFKMFENPNFSVFRIIKDSVKSCIKSIFEFIFVCFMTCRWILLILIGAIILVFVLKISIISSLLSFVLGLLLVSAFFAISAFYCYKNGFVFSSKNDEEVLSLPESEFQIIEEDESETENETEKNY
jgi:hypothetical protein